MSCDDVISNYIIVIAYYIISSLIILELMHKKKSDILVRFIICRYLLSLYLTHLLYLIINEKLEYKTQNVKIRI